MVQVFDRASICRYSRSDSEVSAIWGKCHLGQTLFTVFDRSSSRFFILLATFDDWPTAVSAGCMRLPERSIRLKCCKQKKGLTPIDSI